MTVADFVLHGLLGSITLVLWVAGFVRWNYGRRLRKRGIRTTGTVRAIEPAMRGVSGSGRPLYCPIAEFTDEQGQWYRVAGRLGLDEAHSMLGGPIEVLYLPGRPKGARLEFDTLRGGGSIVGMGFALLALNGFLALILS